MFDFRIFMYVIFILRLPDEVFGTSPVNLFNITPKIDRNIFV